MSLYVISIIISCGLIGAVSASIGVYSVLQKKSLITDAVSHALLPGVVLGFIIAGEKNPFILSVCATIFGLLGAYTIDWITHRTKIKTDAAIGISLSFFFGLGVVLLSHVQNGENASQSGLEFFLLGNAASMQQSDLYFFTALALLIGLATRLLSKEFNLICFNPAYAQSIGLPVKALNFVLRTLVVLTIVAGVQAVGVVLMASCLIVPSIIGNYWSQKLAIIKRISLVSGLTTGLLGALLSYYLHPIPTGPLIVILLTFLAFLSLFFGREGGVILRAIHQRKSIRNVHADHLLKTLYRLYVAKGPIHFAHSEVLSEATLDPKKFNVALQVLSKNGCLYVKGGDLQLTKLGLSEAKRIVRLHRLWELYLLKRLNLPADHVHENAEQMEHVLTPELETALLKELDNPSKDPHQSPIPND